MATRYCGPGGNDANDGLSYANRKLTLNGLEDSPVQAGDVCYIAPGTYREALTVDVSGTAGNVITYIGDYTGANTDGVGGVVRITGSDNDQTVTRANCVTDGGTQRNYRTFTNFAIEITSGYAVNATGGGTNWTINNIMFQSAAFAVLCSGANQAAWTIQNCAVVVPGIATGIGFVFNHSSTVDNTGHLVQNCVLLGSVNASSYGIRLIRVGGVTVKNSTLIGWGSGVQVPIALNAGQTVTVNNCIFCNNIFGVNSVALGWLVENYNTFWANDTARMNVATGANSNAYPPLFDARWFFQLVNAAAANQVITPFDLASYSQLINVAGTSPTTTDMRGTAVQGTQREWGALEYDSTLKVQGGSSGSGAVSISPYRGNIG